MAKIIQFPFAHIEHKWIRECIWFDVHCVSSIKLKRPINRSTVTKTLHVSRSPCDRVSGYSFDVRSLFCCCCAVFFCCFRYIFLLIFMRAFNERQCKTRLKHFPCFIPSQCVDKHYDTFNLHDVSTGSCLPLLTTPSCTLESFKLKLFL